jgi:hypothetical protein
MIDLEVKILLRVEPTAAVGETSSVESIANIEVVRGG